MSMNLDDLDRHITGNYGMDLVEEVDEEPEDTRDFDSMPGGADWEDYDEFYEDFYPDSNFDFYD